jgi:hypothetical protein
MLGGEVIEDGTQPLTFKGKVSSSSWCDGRFRILVFLTAPITKGCRTQLHWPVGSHRCRLNVLDGTVLSRCTRQKAINRFMA